MLFRFIWIKSFRKMIREMQRRKREDTIEKTMDKFFDDAVSYLNGIDDGYYSACEDILEWIEKKEKRVKKS